MKRIFSFLLVSIALCFCNICVVDAALVQSSSLVVFNNETTKNASLTSVVSGNTITVVCAVNSFAAATTITVNDGTAYSTLISIPYQSNIARVGIYYLQNVTAGSKTITITLNRVSYGNCKAQEHNALTTVNIAVDVPVSATGTSQTPATGSTATLSSATGLVITVAGGSGDSWSGATHPPTGGAVYTDIFNDAASFLNSNAAFKYVSANTAVSAAWGTATTINSPWGAVIGFIPLAPTVKPYWYYNRRRH